MTQTLLRKTVTLMLLVVLALCVLVLAACDENDDGIVDPEGTIAIYNGTGAWPDFAQAVAAALDTLGYDTQFITESDAQSGLDGFSVVIIGGGEPLEIASALSFTGTAKIRQLVSSGGGFIGLGNGAYLAADSLVYEGVGSLGSPPIGLYEGTAHGPITALAPNEAHSMALVTITNTGFDPELVGSISSLYRGGPDFQINSPVYGEIARYVQVSASAGVYFELGFGRVSLLSFHPEIEEDSPSDGTTFGDDLDDPDSELFLIRMMTEWCLRQF
ncbi:hypothetical protein KQI52_16530 [bacterium]|nr:hypothetical protein [bacterium]